MRKKFTRIGTMALAGTMLLTPVSSVWAAGESSEIATFSDGSEVLMDDVNNSADETDNPEIEPAGFITTAYVVTASSLYVRSGRGTSYSVLGSLYKGQTVQVYNNSLSKGWVKIKFAGSVGYVSASYIEKK